ncbi:MAG: Fic family protein [Ignavibacteria bacterium]|nr:Fic family protein [Ignavibacteria bacterium]
MRSGKFLTQLSGDIKYRAFVPSSKGVKIEYDDTLRDLLSKADVALGRLDGIAEIIPDVDFFIMMYVKKEATLSSQIEGTQATFSDLLKADADIDTNNDVDEIVNYVEALNYGLNRMNELPLSLRLIKEIHNLLLKGVRGEQKSPGEFRVTQNWVGGSSIQNAVYVPPPVHEMIPALYEFEKFLHEKTDHPVLIKTGLIHSQFETIHPFLDGNGRIGRLLITHYLCFRHILKKPLLYISEFFKAHKQQYYDRLTAIREKDDIEGWLKFFLDGIKVTSESAVETIRKIIAIKEADSVSIIKKGRVNKNSLKLLEHLFRNPVVTIRIAEKILDLKNPNAIKVISSLVDSGILKEVTGRKRNKIFIYKKYTDLFLK